MKNGNYKSYIKLKNRLNGKLYNGYPLHLVLGSYLGMMTWKPSFSLFLSYILLNIKSLKIPKSESHIYTYSTNRDDYIELIKGYFPDANPQYVRIENGKKEKLFGLWYSIFSLIKSMIFVAKIKCDFNERMKLLIAVSIAFKIIDKLEKQHIECDKYIAFNSSYLIESFLSFYFRKRGVKTYSLQHGMYFKYENEIPFDVINYENVCADELLVWGEFSKNEIKGLMPKTSSATIFGYPESKFPIISAQELSTKVLVLLPRDLYIKESLMLLNYLKKYELEYIVRPHPSVIDEVNQFINLEEKFELDANKILSETLKNFKYLGVISFNSTAIFEASLCLQNVLLFDSKEAEFKNPGFNAFSLESDVINVLKDSSVLEHEYFFTKANMNNLRF